MEKLNKKTEVKRLLNEGKSTKEIALTLKTNIAYVYKLKREISNINKD